MTDKEKAAESWELSCHKDGLSVIANGDYAGKTLAEYIEAEGKAVLGKRGERLPEFPLLIKLIDAKENLSLQVHPDDEYAHHVEHQQGKTEMWYVVEAEPGAELCYGFKEKITKSEVKRRIEDNTLLDICNKVPVKKGDVLFIEPGTLHAIGAGTFICEVQQSSNVTYRVYDYGRGRELHIKKALDVLKLNRPKRGTKPLAEMDFIKGAGIKLLANSKYFRVFHVAMESGSVFKVGDESFQAVTILKGAATLKTQIGAVTVNKGETVFLPAGLGEYSFDSAVEFILSEI